MRVNSSLVAFVVGFVISFLVACGPAPKTCGPGNCTGCCDENGECLAGTALFECGSGGNACVKCEANLVCSAGACGLIDGGDYDGNFPGDPDASFRDAGVYDAGPRPDAGVDAGTPDAGRPDSGMGTPDSGTPDAGRPDAGSMDAGTPDAGPPDAGTPVSFMNDVQTIFDNRCNSCHTWSYSNTVNASTGCGGAGSRRIVANNLNTSVIYQKIAGTPPCGGQMPPASATQLTQQELDTIRDWILQGALNN